MVPPIKNFGSNSPKKGLTLTKLVLIMKCCFIHHNAPLVKYVNAAQ